MTLTDLDLPGTTEDELLPAARYAGVAWGLAAPADRPDGPADRPDAPADRPDAPADRPDGPEHAPQAAAAG
jgi:hypothetical protein